MMTDQFQSVSTEVTRKSYAYRWEPPDTMWVKYLGDIDGPTAAALGRDTRGFTLGKPYVFLIVNLSRSGTVNSEARRISTENGKGLAIRGVAVVGASATLRVLATLATRAMAILHRVTDNPTRFFDTDAEARNWIVTRRREIGAPTSG